MERLDTGDTDRYQPVVFDEDGQPIYRDWLDGMRVQHIIYTDQQNWHAIEDTTEIVYLDKKKAFRASQAERILTERHGPLAFNCSSAWQWAARVRKGQKAISKLRDPGNGGEK